MKKIFYIIVLVLVFGCNSENTGDCWQTAGDIITYEVEVPSFSKILVNRDIELVIKEGEVQKVTIETGENLQNDVSAVVNEDQLVLTDDNSCNFFRDYGITKVYVVSPNITEIRSSTQYDISSDGVLTYPSLTILSEDFNNPDSFTSANFNLQIDITNFTVVFNGLSNCFITGKTNTLNVTLASGTSRFEGRDLVAQHIQLWNRSSNDMIVNAQQSIKGTISGTGDVILVNKPEIVEVEELYKGRLIFE